MTILENLELGGYIGRARKVKEEHLEWVFQMFPVLRQRIRQIAGTLSGGEQQMLAIARALMSDPKLLLVDELSLGLAPIIVKNIYKTLREINKSRNVTILVVEQNVRLALEVADRAYVIENGRITMEGAGKELLASEAIKSDADEFASMLNKVASPSARSRKRNIRSRCWRKLYVRSDVR